MGLFSFLSKNKQASKPTDSAYVSRDDDATAQARSKRASNAGGGASGKSRRGGKEMVDPVLPEKKRARRRLVGAIALALGVAVGLPMILDSEPKPLNSDIAIDIPAKDKPAGEAAAPAVAAPAAKAPAVADDNGLDPSEEVVAVAKPAPAAVSPAPAPATVAAKPVVTSKPAAVVQAPAKPAAQPRNETHVEPVRPPKALVAEVREPKPEPKLEPKLEPRSEPKPDPKPVVKVEPKHEPKPVPKPAADSGDDAARALSILEGKSAAKPVETGSRFVVQVAALATQDKVDELQGKLRGAGIASYTQKVPTASGERVIRVRLGPFASRDEADKARARLSKIGLNGSVVPAG